MNPEIACLPNKELPPGADAAAAAAAILLLMSGSPMSSSVWPLPSCLSLPAACISLSLGMPVDKVSRPTAH